MKVQRRIVNTKRHTVGYVIGGRRRTLREAVTLTKKGKVDGVAARQRQRSEYITSLPGHISLNALDSTLQ